MIQSSNFRNRTQYQHSRKHPEGAAMLVVMLVLMMMSATAVIALQSAQYEMRTAGNFRRRHQAVAVADAGLDATFAYVDHVTPGALLRTMDETAVLNSATPLNLKPFEPQLLPNKQAHRIYPEDFPMYDDPSTTAKVETFYEDNLIGDNSLYQPFFAVDLYDVHEYNGVAAGKRVDGRGKFKYLKVTYTSRGRLRIPAATIANPQQRAAHEVSATSRGYAISGPFTP